ncbi:MAG: glycosyl transferase family 2 [Clostridia bacterium]|nr:glycosyl transferase family 2 [Clostridia bacterium]
MTIRFPENPKVSIITSCRNCETVLENTIRSVIQQSYQNIEYIIVDGNSTDGTLDVIKRYEDSITKWISEPDKGVYDGMNKGIIHSTGEVLYFLNAGDYLYNDKVIERIVQNFSDSVFAVYGNVEVFNEHRKKKLIRGCRVTPNKLLYRHICHQALFVRRCLFEEIGMYSDSFKLAADHDFIVKAMMKYPGNFLYLNEVLAVYRDGGMSCKMMDRMKIEELKILSSNYNKVQYIFGTAVCAYVVLRYKIPYYLGLKSAQFE